MFVYMRVGSSISMRNATVRFDATMVRKYYELSVCFPRKVSQSAKI